MKIIEGYHKNDVRRPVISQKQLPEAIASMVLGIISCAAFWFYGSGIVVAVIAMRKIRSDEDIYFSDPEAYHNSYKFTKIAKITSKVGFWVGIGFTALLIVQIILELS